MSNHTDVAAKAASELSEAELDLVRDFSREPILLEGETLADLVPGTARLRAVDAALAEIDDGAETPSMQWRRDYSLLLGLERLLSEDKPELLDGAELNDHQVDALSGTLAAMTTELESPRAKRGERSQRQGQTNGNEARSRQAAHRAAADRETRRRADLRETSSSRGEELAESEEPEEEEPQDWEEPDAEADEELVARRPRIRAPTAGSGSSTRPAPARPWPLSASSRPRAPAACSSSPTAATSSTSSSARSRRAATRIASRRRCSTAPTIPTARSRSRPTSGSCATRGASRTPTRS